MDDKNQQRQAHIKGTKCETCCDSSYCWNALTALRDECLGPFKDLEDFKKKRDEFYKAEEEKADMDRWERKLKYDMFRELRSYAEHKKELAKRKREEDGKKDK